MSTIGFGAIQFPLDTELVGYRREYEDCIETLIESAIDNLDAGHRLIALPEYLGLFSLLFGKEELLADTDSLKGVMASYVSDEFKSISWLRVRLQVSWGRAILLEGQDQIADFYFSFLPDLARRYDTYIVGGTAPLSLATVEDNIPEGVPGRPASGGKGTVHSVSVLFDPSGEPRLVARKVKLTDLENEDKLDLVAANPQHLATAETDLGTIGIGIGRDPFHEKPQSALEQAGTDILVQPAANPSDWSDPAVQEEWCHGLVDAVDSQTITYGIAPMLSGTLLDMPFAGQSSITGPPRSDGSGFRDLDPQSVFVAVAEKQQGAAVVTTEEIHPSRVTDTPQNEP